MSGPLPDNIISAAEAAEVEEFYRRLTTPWRCRLGWHCWEPWEYLMSIKLQAQNLHTERWSQRGRINIEARLCPGCGKIEARATRCRSAPARPPQAEDDL